MDFVLPFNLSSKFAKRDDGKRNEIIQEPISDFLPLNLKFAASNNDQIKELQDFCLPFNLSSKYAKRKNEQIPKHLSLIKKISKEEQKVFIDSLFADEVQRELIANETQGSEGWLKSRIGRLTGSIISSCVGHNPFCNHRKLISQLLWSSFQGNEATSYGTLNEPNAEGIYSEYQATQNVEFSIKFSGLLIHPDLGFLAYSPDGLVIENGIKALLEIKCPFKKMFYEKIPLMYYDRLSLDRVWIMITSIRDLSFTCPMCFFLNKNKNVRKIGF